MRLFRLSLVCAALVFIITFSSATLLIRRSEPVMIPEGRSAVFCHSVQRCSACRKIEHILHGVLKTHTDIQFVSLEYDVPENREFVERFDIGTATVLLVEKKNARIVRSKDLTQKIWANIDDDSQLQAVLEREMKF